MAIWSNPGMPFASTWPIRASPNIGREFSDTVQFRSPPPALQKAMFAMLAPLAHALGYRGTYPELSRSLVRPDPPTPD